MSDQAEGGSIGARLGGLAALAVVLVLGNSCAWFVTGKTPVIVLGEQGGQLGIVAEYHTTGPDYLFGLPAASLRLAGMEPPRRIEGPGGAVDPWAVEGLRDGNDLIVVNPTARDVHYTARVYGDDASLPRGARTGTTLVPAGSARAVVGKTHGQWRFGCRQRPAETENFGVSSGSEARMAVLSWFTLEAPERCEDGARAE